MGYHAVDGVISLTGVDGHELVGFTVDREAAEVDASVQGVAWSSTKKGQETWTIRLTMYVTAQVALPAVGTSGAITLTFKDDTTDGTYTGTVIVTAVNDRYQLNNQFAIDVTMKNQGAMVLTTDA